MMTLTLPQTNGSHASTTTSAWLQSSVQGFFSAINWEDSPPEVQTMKQAAIATPGASAAPISMAMSVNQFFATVNWDNATIAAPVQTAQPASQPKPNEITLDDFSDLF